MAKRKGSKRWLAEHLDDHYVKLAQQQGLRARSAFKLIELQEKYRLVRPGLTVVDLGAAPGGWCQVVLPLVDLTRAANSVLERLDLASLVEHVIAELDRLLAAGAGAVDLEFSTFLGGNADDNGWGVALDTLGDIYTCGVTSAADFPATAGAYDQSYNLNIDAFVAKYKMGSRPTLSSAANQTFTVGDPATPISTIIPSIVMLSQG